MKKIIVNALTGEETLIDLTAEEISENEQSATQRAEEIEAKRVADENKENLKASAKSKLIAGEALTEEEANTIVL